MCNKVNFFPDKNRVSIDSKLYTIEELEKKDKNEIEKLVLETLKEFIKRREFENQIEIHFDEVEPLVKSDMFKGDNHSRPLLNEN